MQNGYVWGEAPVWDGIVIADFDCNPKQSTINYEQADDQGCEN